MDGEYVADLVADPGVPPQTVARLEAAERLASTLQDLMRRPLGNPSRRAVWAILDKVLNRALGFDARILDPSSFMDVATRLDQVVLDVAVKVMGTEHSSMDPDHMRCLRLSTALGGCGLMAASTKCLFKKRTSSCLYFQRWPHAWPTTAARGSKSMQSWTPAAQSGACSR